MACKISRLEKDKTSNVFYILCNHNPEQMFITLSVSFLLWKLNFCSPIFETHKNYLHMLKRLRFLRAFNATFKIFKVIF